MKRDTLILCWLAGLLLAMALFVSGRPVPAPLTPVPAPAPCPLPPCPPEPQPKPKPWGPREADGPSAWASLTVPAESGTMETGDLIQQGPLRPKGLDFNIHLIAPAELKTLIDRIGPGFDGVIKAAWFEGLQSACIVLVPVILCLLFELIRTKRAT